MKPAHETEAVLSRISRKTSIPESRLSMDSQLLQDFGVHGDDAQELLLESSEVFLVDFSDFIFGRHFRSEPSLLSILKPPSARRREFAEKTPVRIGDLVAAVKCERWTYSSDDEAGPRVRS